MNYEKILKFRNGNKYIIDFSNYIIILDLHSKTELKRSVRTQKAAKILSDHKNYKQTTKTKLMTALQRKKMTITTQLQHLLNISLTKKTIYNYENTEKF